MLKADLRREALARRRALPHDEWLSKSFRLRELLFEHLPVTQWEWLHLFLPIEKHNEPNTFLITRWVWGRDLPTQLVVPAVQKDGQLKHFHLERDTLLRENKWGILEPVKAQPVAPELLSAVLVPLLAFDEQGQRVGYGKGFYDRFLLECPQALRIGYSLEPPVPRITDAWPGDVRLNACVTPERVWRF